VSTASDRLCSAVRSARVVSHSSLTTKEPQAIVWPTDCLSKRVVTVIRRPRRVLPGREYSEDLLPKVKIELVVPNDMTEIAIKTSAKSCAFAMTSGARAPFKSAHCFDRRVEPASTPLVPVGSVRSRNGRIPQWYSKLFNNVILSFPTFVSKLSHSCHLILGCKMPISRQKFWTRASDKGKTPA